MYAERLRRGRTAGSGRPLLVMLTWLSLAGSGVVVADCRAEGPGPQWPRVAPPAQDTELEARIAAMVAGMSLEQKVGQMVQAEIKSVTPEEAGRHYLGSVLNGGGSFPDGRKDAGVQDWLALADRFHEASVRHGGIPLIWGTDAVHGHNNVMGATLFPHNIGLGAAGDPELVQRIGRATAAEVAVTGLDWVFAPTLAVVRDDRWGRTYEGYSEDPEIVAAYGGPVITGLQGKIGSDEFLAAGRVIATAKHFIGDGGTDRGVDQGDNLAGEEDLRDIHGAGYFTALAAGAQTVMASFNSWQGEKLHGQRHLLTGVLKEQMGFDGFVVSDWNGIGQVPGCRNDSCPQAINAGIDMVMVPEDWKAFIANTVRQVRDGQIPMQRIDDAVSRILRVKLRSGLMQGGKPSSRPLAGHSELLGSAEHRALARQAVRESLVLLKNRDGLLPLRPASRVLVAGSGADDIGRQSGGWTLTWQGTGNTNDDFPGATSIYQGIRQALAAQGGEAVLSPDGSFQQAPDAAVVVFGEPPYAEGQGDREDLNYSATNPGDLALLRSLRARGIPVVAVLLAGRPLWVNAELNASDAFVVAWLPGSEGAGVADVLIAGPDGQPRFDFRGRLSFSWPARPDQVSVNRGDAGAQALFPYGYGLRYGQADPLAGDLPEQAAAADAGGVAGGDIRVFDRRAVPPFRMMLGDAGGWQQAVSGSSARSSAGAISVEALDFAVQEDARRVSWSGRGEGQLYFIASEPLDLGSLEQAALQFALRVEQAPEKKVTLRMGCVYPCASNADITALLKGLPPDTWARVSVDLACFARQGLDLKRVDVPFLLLGKGRLGLSFADIRIVPGAARDATIRCSNGE